MDNNIEIICPCCKLEIISEDHMCRSKGICHDCYGDYAYERTIYEAMKKERSTEE